MRGAMAWPAPAVAAAWGSLGVGALVTALKFAAYALTGSIALYSDALESVVNVATAAITIAAMRISLRPADANHPYGHSKAEYVSAVIEGGLVLAAAVTIVREAYIGWLFPAVPSAPLAGLAGNAAATVLNLVWGLRLRRLGRRLRAPALAADSRHILTDVWTSGGVLTGFALVPATGWLWLDPVIALGVAANVLWSGYVMLRDSMGGLMDHAADPELLERIRAAVTREASGAIEAHDVRSRHSGRTTFVEFHLVVPGEMSVREAHAICDRVEAALRREAGEAVIHIHVEPEEKAKRHDVLVMQ